MRIISFFFLFTCFINSIYSQSINVNVQHILCDASGNLTQQGQVTIFLDPEGAPYSINPLAPCQDPPEIILQGLIYIISAVEPVIIGEDIPCPGVYCFDIVANLGTDFECCTSICEEVMKCRAVETLPNGDIPHELVYECFNIVMPPPEEGRGNIVSQIPGPKENKINNRTTKVIPDQIGELFLNKPNIKLNNVFPNPFINSIQLNIESSHDRKLNTRIINLSGQLVYNEDVFIVEGDNLKEINSLDKLPSGIYFLMVVDSVSKEEISIQKIIKSKI